MLHAEVNVAQLCKHGEELCGDNVQVTRTGDSVIVVVSDGLGSGVKANILATLTTKIASSMLARGANLDDVVETIAQTLPVCKERKIAYSTLQILRIDRHGNATLVEFDSPRTFLCRAGHVLPFPAQERTIGGKTVLVQVVNLFLTAQCHVACQRNDFHARSHDEESHVEANLVVTRTRRTMSDGIGADFVGIACNGQCLEDTFGTYGYRISAVTQYIAEYHVFQTLFVILLCYV